jgi:4-amino-4-deoxy-L-arabinose transferase-like glycosyltransferase
MLLFALLIVVSSVPRMIGLGWGLPERYHCDARRTILSSFKFATGQTTKPADTVYSPLTAYLSKTAYLVSGGKAADTQPKTARFLRGVSAITSSLTAPVLFLAATALFGIQGGLVSALCLAFAPGAIREAHFATVDSFLTFSLVAVFAAGVLVVQRPKSRLWILLPVSVGLALAVKISALPAVIALVLLVPRVSPGGTTRRMISAPVFVVLVFTVLAWNMVADPRHYAFWAGKSGLDRTGVTQSYYSLQFNRVQPLGGLISLLWMAGPLLLIGGLLGTASVVHMICRRPVLLLAFIPPFLASFLECFTGGIPFVRTALPLIPLLALAAGSGISFVWGRRTQLAASLAGTIIVGSGIAGAAYCTVYLEPDTRAQTERWLKTHWSPGEMVLLDGTDGLITFSSIPKTTQRSLRHPAQHALQQPVDVEALALKDKLLFRLAEWGATRKKDRALLKTLRAPPPVPTPKARSAALHRQIRDATWIVTTGTEQARYLAHPDVFDPEIAFYESLFSGRSGFEVATTFSAPELPYPRFLTPEPSWFFFDHPRVVILRRIEH